MSQNVKALPVFPTKKENLIISWWYTLSFNFLTFLPDVRDLDEDVQIPAASLQCPIGEDMLVTGYALLDNIYVMPQSI